ncbi:MAG: hypothetical protein SFY67_15500 [Candidatus Melainabacteria bacterium]|nr:hypothetical protein [Candidatus Melainabacteria bacterium]
MDKTLFLPSMIEAFSLCKRSYIASMKSFENRTQRLQGNSNSQGISLLKQFVKKGIAEINRHRVTSSHHVQAFTGEYWPLEQMEKQNLNQDQTTRLFLYSYKLLMSYVRKPYKPQGAQVALVGQKLRAKVPGAKVYLEDTFDLVLWYPDTRTIEIVDFRLRPSSIANLNSASAYILARQFLADKLKTRMHFQNLVMTTCLMGQNSMQVESIRVEDSNLHNESSWQKIVDSLIEMKSPDFSEASDLETVPACDRPGCIYCSMSKSQDDDNDSHGLCLSA